MEEWRDIEGFEGYQVSDKGNVRSLDRVVIRGNGRKQFWKGRILKQHLHQNGYLHVILTIGSKQTSKLVHRLVAEAFIPNSNNHPQVNHINEVKTDNMTENLEWCDGKYNTNYGTAMQRSTERRRKTVYQYTLDNQLVKVWSSVNECGRNGFCVTNVCACCLGKHKTHKGFKWSYAPLEP